MKNFKVLLLLITLFFTSGVLAIEPFIVKDVKVNGLQRITAGAVFNALTIKVGEQFTDEKSENVIRELFQMGCFNNVEVSA